MNISDHDELFKTEPYTYEFYQRLMQTKPGLPRDPSLGAYVCSTGHEFISKVTEELIDLGSPGMPEGELFLEDFLLRGCNPYHQGFALLVPYMSLYILLLWKIQAWAPKIDDVELLFNSVFSCRKQDGTIEYRPSFINPPDSFRGYGRRYDNGGTEYHSASSIREAIDNLSEYEWEWIKHFVSAAENVKESSLAKFFPISHKDYPEFNSPQSSKINETFMKYQEKFPFEVSLLMTDNGFEITMTSNYRDVPRIIGNSFYCMMFYEWCINHYMEANKKLWDKMRSAGKLKPSDIDEFFYSAALLKVHEYPEAFFNDGDFRATACQVPHLTEEKVADKRTSDINKVLNRAFSKHYGIVKGHVRTKGKLDKEALQVLEEITDDLRLIKHRLWPFPENLVCTRADEIDSGDNWSISLESAISKLGLHLIKSKHVRGIEFYHIRQDDPTEFLTKIANEYFLDIFQCKYILPRLKEQINKML
ncbi:MAG TPA: hypothetical protein PK922_14025 [Syntrophorhabdus sp.]|jgi:hypothetical protein|nr:hypothetical protein [Syntrophorhabdus sp.]